MRRRNLSERKAFIFSAGLFIGLMFVSFFGLTAKHLMNRTPADDISGGRFIKPAWRGDEDPSALRYKVEIVGPEDTRRPVYRPDGHMRTKDLRLAQVLKAVTAVYKEENGSWTSLGSAVLTENRQILLTVAHVVVDEGKSNFGPEIDISKLKVYFQECNKVYTAAKFVRGSDGYLDQEGRDIGIIVLTERVCDAVQPVRVASRIEILKNGLVKANAPLVVAGAYAPILVHQQREKELGSNRDYSTADPNAPDRLVVRSYYDDNCFLKGWGKWRDQSIEQTIIVYDCDADGGGSGGPVFTSINGGWYLLAIHRGYASNHLNLGILVSDWFEAIIKEAFRSVGDSYPTTTYPLGGSSPVATTLRFSI